MVTMNAFPLFGYKVSLLILHVPFVSFLYLILYKNFVNTDNKHPVK